MTLDRPWGLLAGSVVLIVYHSDDWTCLVWRSKIRKRAYWLSKESFCLKDYLFYFSITLVFFYIYINRLLVSSLYDVVFLLMIFILGADPYTFTVWGIYSSQKLEQSVSKFWIWYPASHHWTHNISGIESFLLSPLLFVLQSYDIIEIWYIQTTCMYSPFFSLVLL